ncbi:MAG: NAD-dependent epimerase/dehydratase family protein, partial [Mycolicibacterium sp.]|nr:NAD-dependent epimerase/dehydratase family protein [Mycolicibacterium sp.]
MLATDPVLVTGAFGLVGTAVVKQLLADGRRVVATDLDVPANRKSAAELIERGADVRWADLTKPDQVDELLSNVSPCAIVHLAAIIPPHCYARRALARAVNVDATASLVRAASAQPSPPRFVQASSVAVYGARNPHTISDVLTADTPPAPSDNYGAHKVEAEKTVTSSGLDWVVLRLGGVMSSEARFGVDLGTAITTAVGLVGGMPPGRPGNPDSNRDWFATDWMDTARSQQVLRFQQHTWPDTLADMRADAGLKRYPLR